MEEFRHCQKLLTTYIEPLEKKSIQEKTKEDLPRIHTQWGHTGTATGRLSSSNPNLQNIPKMPLSVKLDDDLDSQQTTTINIREGFCSRKGFVFFFFSPFFHFIQNLFFFLISFSDTSL
jgi:DNA polymerase I-like protein with 3'-5' exonuclease and polymerase domains